MKISDFTEYYQKQIREKLNEKISYRNTGSASNKKRNIKDQSVEAETVTRFDRPVSIAIYTTRRRQTDNRAIEDKYFVDALVTAGVLQDDTKKDVARLDVPEPRIGKDEKTIIEIIEIEGI